LPEHRLPSLHAMVSPSKKLQYAGIPAGLIGPIAKEFDDDETVRRLFNEFLECRGYNRAFALKLIAAARRDSGNSWETRRLAVLMLENQILRLSPEDRDEFDLLFVALRMKRSPGAAARLDDDLLKEGYSTTDLESFIPQFRLRLQRLERLHRKIRGKRTSHSALQDFIELARRDCRLSLARYLFQPQEVVERILARVRISSGMPDIHPSVPDYLHEQVRHVRDGLPPFERAILDELCRTGSIYWVARGTSSEINSLVEYPLTTVVLVIKPPGSHIEFEIKRAGRRGPNPLGVVHSRDGHLVPSAHQLDGGSMQWLLRYEAVASTRLACIYRIAHGTDAPISTFISRAAVSTIPTSEDPDYIASYFTNPQYFGRGFRQMRDAMKHVVDSDKEKGETDPLDGVGDLGLTVQFLIHVTPAQGILCGTTSFRLDKLAAYLSADGPEVYFKTGLRIDYSKHDARRLADEVLDEVLGIYTPPAAGYRSHNQYVESALAANRQRADGNYLDIVEQIGAFWGSLLAVRGYSWGESFVARNVGLRSVWEQGEWKVKIIFMDHDSMNLPDRETEHFFPKDAFAGFYTDAVYIGGGFDGVYTGCGYRGSRSIKTEIGLLGDIYRVKDDIADRGRQLLLDSMAKAYRKTQSEIASNTRLRRFFTNVFIDRIRDWDILANGYVSINGDQSKLEGWKAEMEKTLLDRGYTPKLAKQHLETLDNFRDFIQRKSFLYDPRYCSFKGPAGESGS
jgi:hypothetical protein